AKAAELADSVPFVLTCTSAFSVPSPLGVMGAIAVISVGVAARTSAGCPENVTSLPAGAGSKPRPAIFTRSPGWPLYGVAAETIGRRPTRSSIHLAASLASLTGTALLGP